jgi:cephalosporin hydroxylase
VISIDIDRSRYNVKHERIIEMTGDSSAPEIIEKVAGICRGKTVMVFHDGDHSKRQVLEDLTAYSGFVNKGSYIVVEDGIVDLFRPGDGLGSYTEGPMAACEAFVKENTDFVIDKERERYIMTYNPSGFLRRVK